MNRRRVVITGLGFCTALGCDTAEVWRRLLAGESGIRRLRNFDIEDYPTKIAGQIHEFDAEQWMDRRTSRRVDTFTAYAIAAAQQAAKDAGIVPAGRAGAGDDDGEPRGSAAAAPATVAAPLNFDPDRAGVILGSGIGGINEIETQHKTLMNRGPQKVSPHFVPRLMSNAAVGQLSILFGFRGTSFTTTSACSSGAHAAGMALRAIQFGDADLVMTGGTEAAISRLGMIGFCSARAMSTRNDEPEKASRPFDLHRDGFVMGEGAGVLFFEELEDARARGAHIYAEVVGYGATSDAYHMTAPASDGDGATRAMLLALRDGGIDPERVNYINAHGTSTILNDRIETLAIKRALGEGLARRVAISSTKSMIGHLLGAAPGVELGISALSVHHQQVHPTINLTTPDPECDLDYVPHEGRDLKIDVVLSNSFGFGGHNACLALARYEG